MCQLSTFRCDKNICSFIYLYLKRIKRETESENLKYLILKIKSFKKYTYFIYSEVVDICFVLC